MILDPVLPGRESRMGFLLPHQGRQFLAKLAAQDMMVGRNLASSSNRWRAQVVGYIGVLLHVPAGHLRRLPSRQSQNLKRVICRTGGQ